MGRIGSERRKASHASKNQITTGYLLTRPCPRPPDFPPRSSPPLFLLPSSQASSTSPPFPPRVFSYLFYVPVSLSLFIKDSRWKRALLCRRRWQAIRRRRARWVSNPARVLFYIYTIEISDASALPLRPIRWPPCAARPPQRATAPRSPPQPPPPPRRPARRFAGNAHR